MWLCLTALGRTQVFYKLISNAKAIIKISESVSSGVNFFMEIGAQMCQWYRNMSQLFYLSLLAAVCLGISLHTARLYICVKLYCRFGLAYLGVTWHFRDGERCKIFLPLQASEDFCCFICIGETICEVKQFKLQARGESNNLMRACMSFTSSSSGTLLGFSYLK